MQAACEICFHLSAVNQSLVQQNLTWLMKASGSANCYTAQCSFQLIIYPSPCPAENKTLCLLSCHKTTTTTKKAEQKWTFIYSTHQYTVTRVRIKPQLVCVTDITRRSRSVTGNDVAARKTMSTQ